MRLCAATVSSQPSLTAVIYVLHTFNVDAAGRPISFAHVAGEFP